MMRLKRAHDLAAAHVAVRLAVALKYADQPRDELGRFSSGGGGTSGSGTSGDGGSGGGGSMQALANGRMVDKHSKVTDDHVTGDFTIEHEGGEVSTADLEAHVRSDNFPMSLGGEAGTAIAGNVGSVRITHVENGNGWVSARFDIRLETPISEQEPIESEGQYTFNYLGVGVNKSKKATASIDDMLSGYESDLQGLIQELLRGGHRTSKADFRRQMKGQIRDYAREGFRVAWEEGGGDVDEAKPDELSKIQDWTKEQQGHVNDFADWLTNKDSDLDAVPDRVALWAAAYESFLNDVKTTAMGDPMGKWKYGDTDHCDTCLELDGQVHRLSWFKDQNYYPRKPGAEMDCGGYRCQCEIQNPKTGERLL